MKFNQFSIVKYSMLAMMTLVLGGFIGGEAKAAARSQGNSARDSSRQNEPNSVETVMKNADEFIKKKLEKSKNPVEKEIADESCEHIKLLSDKIGDKKKKSAKEDSGEMKVSEKEEKRGANPEGRSLSKPKKKRLAELRKKLEELNGKKGIACPAGGDGAAASSKSG